MYYVFRTNVLISKRKPVVASLITPFTSDVGDIGDCRYGIKLPKQIEPYGVNLDLTYKVDPNLPKLDNYYDSFGFDLFSEKLIGILRSFGVVFETVDVSFVDLDERPIKNFGYKIFHLLGEAKDVLDKEASGYIPDRGGSIKQLVIKEGLVNNTPMFVVKDAWCRVIREDLYETLIKEKITGFEYFRPLDYRTGKYRYS